jgi:hypothetical protein
LESKSSEIPRAPRINHDDLICSNEQTARWIYFILSDVIKNGILMWPAFRNKSKKFTQPRTSSGVIVDFLDYVWYASIEVEAFLKTTSPASGGWGKIESKSHF